MRVNPVSNGRAASTRKMKRRTTTTTTNYDDHSSLLHVALLGWPCCPISFVFHPPRRCFLSTWARSPPAATAVTAYPLDSINAPVFIHHCPPSTRTPSSSAEWAPILAPSRIRSPTNSDREKHRSSTSYMTLDTSLGSQNRPSPKPPSRP